MGNKFNIGDLVYYNDFEVGDLVYYNGFEVFEPRKRYIGVVMDQTFEEHYRGEDHYNVFWFDSGLTTRMHCDNIILVYDEKGRA